MDKVKVLLVDDHALVRAGIRSLVDQLPDFAVIAEASNPAEALDTLDRFDRQRPDLIVTDLSMGSDNGMDFIRVVGQRHPDLRVMVLSMHGSEQFVAEALQLGASSYLLKESAPEELECALRAVVRGEVYLDTALSKKMIAWFVRAESPSQKPLDALTERQLQILTMIAKGMPTKEIAFQLGLSDKTIAAHRSQIMDRLGVQDRAGLILFALKNGLVKATD